MGKRRNKWGRTCGAKHRWRKVVCILAPDHAAPAHYGPDETGKLIQWKKDEVNDGGAVHK